MAFTRLTLQEAAQLSGYVASTTPRAFVPDPELVDFIGSSHLRAVHSAVMCATRRFKHIPRRIEHAKHTCIARTHAGTAHEHATLSTIAFRDGRETACGKVAHISDEVKPSQYFWGVIIR